ncbi:MAG: hypothetical protein ACOCVZ_08915, partial [Gemmatimonadota bacterium]
MTRIPFAWLAAAMALAPAAAAAQIGDPVDSVPPAPAASADSPAPGDTLPGPLTAEDYGQWETLGQALLSPDGDWLAYFISRVNDENELRVRRVGSD